MPIDSPATGTSSLGFSSKENDSLQVIDSFAERANKISLLLNSLEVVKNSEGFVGLSSRLKSDLAALKAEFYTLRELAGQSAGEQNKHSTLLKRLQEYSKKIGDLETNFRLLCHQRSKDLLIGSAKGSSSLTMAATSTRRNPTKFSEHSEEQATAKIAATLDNLLEIVTVEVERSGKSAGKLGESSNLLKKTRDEYKGFESLLQTSRQLIHELGKGERKDLLLILGAFLVFFLSVLWVLKVRVLGSVTRIAGFF